MQNKIIFAAISIGLLTALIALAAISEQSRLLSFTLDSQGNQIENGAISYDQQCANCHGEAGYAVECFDESGVEIKCVGAALKNYPIICGDPSPNMLESNFRGSKEEFIVQSTFASHSDESVGSSIELEKFDSNQIMDVAVYLLSDDCICDDAPSTSFVWPERVEELFEIVFEYPCSTRKVVLQPGNIENGKRVYEDYACSACHGKIDTPNSATVGPWLGGIAQKNATKDNSLQYVYESILDPNAYIASGCPNRESCVSGLMPRDYATRFADDPQDLVDLLVYLLNSSVP